MSESDGLSIRFGGNKAEALFAGFARMSDYNHHGPRLEQGQPEPGLGAALESNWTYRGETNFCCAWLKLDDLVEAMSKGNFSVKKTPASK